MTPVAAITTKEGAITMRHMMTAISAVTVAAGALALGQGTAHAREIYEEDAGVANGSPPASSCSSVYAGRSLAGQACFSPNGDKFWIRDRRNDDLHIEARGQANLTGDGFRCYSNANGAGPWRVCDSFDAKIPEGATIAFTPSAWKGNTQKHVGGLKLIQAG